MEEQAKKELSLLLRRATTCGSGSDSQRRERAAG